MKQTLPESGDLLSSTTFYHNLHELPLKIFIKCLLNQKYNLLLISGEANEVELLAAWQKIESLYIEIISGTEGRRIIDLEAEVSILSGRLKMIKIICGIIINQNENNKEVEQFAIMLNKLCKSKFNFKGLEKFENVKRCITRSQSILVSLELKKIQLDLLKEKTKDGEEISEEYFYKALITLSDHAKIALSDNISTFEFFERLTRYTKYAKNILNNNSKRK